MRPDGASKQDICIALVVHGDGGDAAALGEGELVLLNLGGDQGAFLRTAGMLVSICLGMGKSCAEI